jgi:drug/metabolite transporter superfamily protein YnfA
MKAVARTSCRERGDLMDAHTSGGHATGAPAVTVSARTRHATWLAALFVIAFLTPYVLADTLEIQRDVYYALYGGIAITFAWAWVALPSSRGAR